MVHIVKIYFDDPKHGKQIRRLAVSSDVISNFSLLLEKVRNVLQVEINNLEIRWKDPENDYIDMSTDDELAQALANADDGLLRLYTHLKKDGSKKEGNQDNGTENSNYSEHIPNKDGEIHPFVICDACDKKIFGIRYKCLECRDFDLCASCNLRDVHSFHDMIKFVKPTYIPREWVFTGARKLWKSMFNRCPANYFQFLIREKESDPQNKESPHSSSSDDSPAEMENQSSKDLPSNGDKKRTCSDNSKEKMKTDMPYTCGNEQTNSHSKEQNSKQASNDKPNLFADPSKWPGVFLECLNGDFGEAQKLINDGLGQILKTVQVKVDGPFVHTEVKVGQEEKATRQEAEKQTFQKEERVEKESGSSAPNTPTFQTSNPFLKKYDSGLETSQSNLNEADTLKSNTAEVSAASENISSPVIEVSISNSPVSSDIGESSVCAEGWTFLNEDEAKKSGAENSSEKNVDSEKSVTYPDLMEIKLEVNQGNQTNTQTKDPVILSALTTMEAMGFTNEGGWLEKLLITKQGNINATLDALYPGARRA